ncbi:MAG: hypothetical protein K1X89_06950 [Myxococcaceae bacterium]|nr:hypothetical protein [Myxococcaceae bacterium]
MRRRVGWAFAGLLGALALAAAAARFGAPAFPAAVPSSARPQHLAEAAALRAKARVVLVTLDGARWQDVLDLEGTLAGPGERPAMPRLLAALRSDGVALLGEVSASAPRSLPGYQALAVGHPTTCQDNTCPRVAEETLAEELVRRLPAQRGQVQVVGSWARLSRAATSGDAGVELSLPDDGPPGAEGPPWPNARWDEETLAVALRRWKASPPRFLHLALLDMDEWAHQGRRAEVLSALRQADEGVQVLLDAVRALPDDERALTTVLVTADHGRGPWRLWDEHSVYRAGRDVFLVAVGASVHGGQERFTQADVKPTVLRLFGLCPGPCTAEGCGQPLRSVVGALPCAP